LDAALALARFAHFASLMAVFGAAFFKVALAPPPLRVDLTNRWRLALTLVALLSGGVWFVLVAFGMAGDTSLDTLETVAMGTAFGEAWLPHMGIVVGLLAARRAGFVAALSGLALATLALTGHAAMQGGALGASHRLNHAAHLLTTAGWLGGLPPFLACLRMYVATPCRRDALDAMMRYSRVGHFAVPLVLLTGTLETAMITGLPPWRELTPYRVGVLVKVALFLAMTALALVNRYVLAPRVGRDAGAARKLAVGALGEWALGLAAVADVSRFAMTNPS
jgi:putative copper resistance protein D